jgi:hypothetical protein
LNLEIQALKQENLNYSMELGNSREQCKVLEVKIK